jgi:glycosyltransferase involved in cell wall biosynthesis
MVEEKIEDNKNEISNATEKYPLVSVVIPVHNERKHLRRCLDTLFSQSYPNLEIIIIDDNSSQDYSDFLPEYIKKGVVYKKNDKQNGPGYCRNMGVRMAKGEIICFTDADIEHDKEYIMVLTQLIREGKAEATFAREGYIANAKKPLAECWGIPPYPNPNTTSDVSRAILKKTFLEHGGFNPKKGYFDDGMKIVSIGVMGAIYGHYNPEDAREVVIQSKWIGSSFQVRMANQLIEGKNVSSGGIIARNIGLLIGKMSYAFLPIALLLLFLGFFTYFALSIFGILVILAGLGTLLFAELAYIKKKGKHPLVYPYYFYLSSLGFTIGILQRVFTGKRTR